MAAFQIGVKVYDLDWYTRYELSYEKLARLLLNWGIDFVLTQSARLPMADSAVRSTVPPAQRQRLAAFDEQALRQALGAAGIGYWPTLCTFFEPAAVVADDALRPVGADGRPMTKTDWYLGITPAHQGWLARQAERVAQVAGELQPDGLFLSFCRWPGFWELWTPRHRRNAFIEYSYDAPTLARFAAESGCQLPAGGAAAAAAWIAAHEHDRWTQWKCGVITQAARMLAEAARSAHAPTKLLLNTLPFAPGDWDNARAEVFGQDVAALATVVDAFEVMTYHQILMRPVNWIGRQGQQVKQATDKPTYCTIQAAPLYLGGMHAAEGRHERLDADEFAQGVQAARQAGVDGVVVFTLSDLLREALVEGDMRRLNALWAAKS